MTAAAGARRSKRAAAALALLLGVASCHAGSQAASSRYCDARQQLAAADQDRLLRVAAVVKRELDRSGASMALVSRSGIDLERFGQRYSHAGIGVAVGLTTRWAVRQLYYACEESSPRLFDQGTAAFVLGTDDPAVGYVSLVFLPPEQAQAVERAALAADRSLALLGARYSANAYPFSTRYQNCNQWVAELLAMAWMPAPPESAKDQTDAGANADAAAASAVAAPAALAAPAPPAAAAREQAQRWLRDNGYEPTVFEVTWPLDLAAAFVPWVHRDDHPDDDRAARRYRVSMPASIESFVRATMPGAQRIEVCHSGGRVVVHRGWDPVADGCRPGDGDEVMAID